MNWTPKNKVIASSLGTAIATLIISFSGLQLKPEEKAAVAAIASFSIGYLVPDRPASDHPRIG